MADLERNIKYNIDQSAISKAIQQLKKLEKQEADVAKAALSGGDAYADAAKDLAKIRKEQRELQSVLKATGTDFSQQSQDVQKATSALTEYESKIREVKSRGADLGGDFASSTAGIRGSLDALSGGRAGAIGGGLEIAEGISDLTEFVPLLNQQVSTFGDIIRSSDSPIGKLATGAGDAIASVTGLSAGTASFAAIALPAVAVLGTLAVAYNVLQKVQQEQIDAIQAEVDARRTAFDFVQSGATADDALARLDEIQAEIANRQARLLDPASDQYEAYIDTSVEKSQQFASAASDIAGTFLGQFNVITQGLNLADATARNFSQGVTFATQQLSDVEQELFTTREEEIAAIETLQAEAEQLQVDLEAGAFAANDAAQAEQDLADTRASEIARLQALQEQAVNRAGQLEEQRLDIIENAAIQAANSTELEAVQADIARENEAQKAQDHRDKLADIAESGRERIEAIQAEIASLPAEQNADLAKVQADGNQKLFDLQSGYQKSTQRSYADFTKQLSRSTSDAAKAIRHTIEDINQSLDDATRSNDVEAFLKAQRDGEEKLAQQKEDAQEQERRAVEDFIQAQSQERQAFLEKQATIRAEIETEKQAVLQSYAERRSALQEQIEAERQATQERIADERERFAEQLRREQVREEQQQRLEAVRERQQQEAHNRRLQEIETERQRELAASREYLASVERVARAAANIKVSTGNQSPLGSLLGGNPAFSNNTNVNVNSSTTVGDVASKQMVEDGMEGVVTAIVGATLGALGGGKRR